MVWWIRRPEILKRTTYDATLNASCSQARSDHSSMVSGCSILHKGDLVLLIIEHRPDSVPAYSCLFLKSSGRAMGRMLKFLLDSLGLFRASGSFSYLCINSPTYRTILLHTLGSVLVRSALCLLENFKSNCWVLATFLPFSIYNFSSFTFTSFSSTMTYSKE